MNKYHPFDTGSKSPIVVYTKKPCPYCVMLVRLLQSLNYSFEERDLTGQYEEMSRMTQETGWRTFPIVIIHNRVVGGFTDIKALQDQGLLKKMIENI